MGYIHNGIMPDWRGTLSTLKEVLGDVLDTIEEDDRMGVRPDITALNVFDQINQHLDGVKQDLGI